MHRINKIDMFDFNCCFDWSKNLIINKDLARNKNSVASKDDVKMTWLDYI